MSESKSKYLKVPKRIRFPFGYTVVVRQVTLRELKKMAGGDDVYGLWDVDSRTIFVGKHLPVAKKRYVVVHELRHAMADFEHLHAELGVTKAN
jgi:Zn-dependent peptidase ImmA (M78 family)